MEVVQGWTDGGLCTSREARPPWARAATLFYARVTTSPRTSMNTAIHHVRPAGASHRSDRPRPDPADRVPYEPSEQELKAFVRALQATGSLEHPIVVRPVSQGARPFELVAGRLRMEAARQLGWSSIPCHVQSLTREAAVMVGLLEDLAGKRQPQLVLAWRVLAVLKVQGWTQARASPHAHA